MCTTFVQSLDDINYDDQCVVVADRNLPETILQRLPSPILVQAGESIKSLASIEALACKILDRHASLPMTIVAVGGGSLGDALGFLASILWRGVDLWHIPTTLLAMVDSAHGGKTAVNLENPTTGQHYKNQLGTFYPATRTYVVSEVLESLPLDQRCEGLAELIKALWINAPDTLCLLEAHGGVNELSSAPYTAIKDRLFQLIEQAIAVKYRIVEQDPFDNKGIRIALNLGHTVAHALELRYALSHGDAVAWGLACALHVSHKLGYLSYAHYQRLYKHIYPLLIYFPYIGHQRGDTGIIDAISRDKKHRNNSLRSLVLRGPGDVIVTDKISAEQWADSLDDALNQWRQYNVRISVRSPRNIEPSILASKSLLNRLEIIQYLRPCPLQVMPYELYGSLADDVTLMRAALSKMKRVDSRPSTAPHAHQPLELYCGEGGTTFRFLMAIAATRRNQTKIYVEKPLFERPHTGLIQALRKAGATITPFIHNGTENDAHRCQDEVSQYTHGFIVKGWKQAPSHVSVDCTESSQYASAIALLAASGLSFTMATHNLHGSAAYFDMTLDTLAQAGVEISQTQNHITFQPTEKLYCNASVEIEPDASSYAFWHVASFLEPQIMMDRHLGKGKQPDAMIGDLLEQLRTAQQNTIDIDISQCPDLALALAVAALSIRPQVRLWGAPGLRYKESNRIDAFIEALDNIGIIVQATNDGMIIPDGIQAPASGLWETFNDHRMAMAGVLLSSRSQWLEINDPWVITKSYPQFWRDIRRAGWEVQPLLTSSG